MLSLNNTYSFDELKAFDKRVTEFIQHNSDFQNVIHKSI